MCWLWLFGSEGLVHRCSPGRGSAPTGPLACYAHIIATFVFSVVWSLRAVLFLRISIFEGVDHWLPAAAIVYDVGATAGPAAPTSKVV